MKMPGNFFGKNIPKKNLDIRHYFSILPVYHDISRNFLQFNGLFEWDSRLTSDSENFGNNRP